MNFYNLTDDEVNIIVVALKNEYLSGGPHPDYTAARMIVAMLDKPALVRLRPDVDDKAEFDHGFNTYHE